VAKNSKGRANSQSPVEAKGPDDWRAHDDMRTLVRAHQIRRDKKRHSAARAAAKQALSDQQAETGAMQQVANGGTGQQPDDDGDYDAAG
jgi:hypothetical protein